MDATRNHNPFNENTTINENNFIDYFKPIITD